MRYMRKVPVGNLACLGIWTWSALQTCTSNFSLAYRNTSPPAIPPTPPIPTSVAEQNARFHWPRMLFAWYDIVAGTLEFAPAVVRKTPKYRTPALEWKPMMDVPTMHRSMLKMMMGPRRWYLSPSQPVVYMTIAAKAYGGATRHCDSPTEKPMFSVRMIGRKYARA